MIEISSIFIFRRLTNRMGGIWTTGETTARIVACDGPVVERTLLAEGKNIHDLPYMSAERFDAYKAELKKQGVLIWRLPVIKGHHQFD